MFQYILKFVAPIFVWENWVWIFNFLEKYYIPILIVLFLTLRAGFKNLKDEKEKLYKAAKKQGGYVDIADKDILYVVGNDNLISETMESISKNVVLIKTLDGGYGSGFVILTDKGFMILTNQHVVGDDDYIIVKSYNEKEEYGKILRSDENRDVALISFPNKLKIKPLSIATDKISVGEDVYVIGSPLDESLVGSVSKGIVGAFRTEGDLDYIQSDATIHQGNSGGPLLLKSLKVAGMAQSGVANKDGDMKGINNFIPIQDVLDSLNIVLINNEIYK